MSQHKVLFQRIVSPDGRSVATARSEVIIADGQSAIAHQSVTVSVNDQTQSARSFSSSSATSSAASSAGASASGQK
jgi:hypothetical protein